MGTMHRVPTFSPEQLRAAATAVLRAAGADEANAAIVVDHLVDANLTGHDSHGVILIPDYVQAIRQGQIVSTARPEVVRQTSAMTLIDARRSFGQVSAVFATDAVVAKAREHGVAVAGTIRGNHIGRLGYYPTRAAAQGVALLVTRGSLGGSVVPYGGRAGVLGTDPIAFGFPVEGEDPFVLDFATTVIAAGKVRFARDKHEPVPPNTLLDKAGRPTTDPNALFQGGALLPFGGHKGYALSLMTVLLSSVLIRDDADDADDSGGDVGKAFFCAIDTRVFGGGAPAAAAGVLRRVRAVPPAEGFEHVLIPGEPELRTAERRRAEGVPVAEDTWRGIAAVAADLGVSV